MSDEINRRDRRFGAASHTLAAAQFIQDASIGSRAGVGIGGLCGGMRIRPSFVRPMEFGELRAS
jgi:hypothetical protein